jgi:hypothetical protein
LIEWHFSQFGNAVGSGCQLCGTEHVVNYFDGSIRTVHMVECSRLQNCFMKEAFRRRSNQQRCATHRTGRFTENSYLIGIAAEVCNVCPHPLQSSNLIEQADIRTQIVFVSHFRKCPGKVQIPKRTQAVIDRDHHQVVIGCES